MPRICSILECDKPSVARGWCGKHYKRWEIHGDPTFIKTSRDPVKVEIGERYERLVVIAEAGSRRPGGRFVHCRCDCGKETIVRAVRLANGHTQSCGCLRDERRAAGHRTHGLSSHPLYRTWMAMRRRCRNPNSREYQWYGARGITIDPRWDDFPTFLADMGERPGPGYSIDRIDNDGPYSPENCRWATASEQLANRRPRALNDTTNVIFDEEMTAGIDALRGERSRGDWVRALVQEAITPQ